MDNLEGGLDGVVQAIVCAEQVGWAHQARKLMLVATDGLLHFAGEGKVNERKKNRKRFNLSFITIICMIIRSILFSIFLCILVDIISLISVVYLFELNRHSEIVKGRLFLIMLIRYQLQKKNVLIFFLRYRITYSIINQITIVFYTQ